MTTEEKLLKVRALYEEADRLDDELHTECVALIEPLLDEKRYDDAKHAVRAFYKPMRCELGEVRGIGYDCCFMKINQRRTADSK